MLAVWRGGRAQVGNYRKIEDEPVPEITGEGEKDSDVCLLFIYIRRRMDALRANRRKKGRRK